MKNDLTCAVVRDLLPAYAEGLTAPETNDAVERHLSGCPNCAAKLAAMRAPEEEPEHAETAKEVDYLKKVKRRGWLRVTLAILLTLAVLLGALAAKVFLIGSPASADTMAVRTWTAGGSCGWTSPPASPPTPGGGGTRRWKRHCPHHCPGGGGLSHPSHRLGQNWRAPGGRGGSLSLRTTDLAGRGGHHPGDPGSDGAKTPYVATPPPWAA